MAFVKPQPARHADAAKSLPDVKLLIGDKWISNGSAGTFAHVNTSTGEKQGAVPLAGAVDVDAAVAAARRAFPAWRDTDPYRRRKIMDRFADLLESNIQRFIRMAPVENGIPLSVMEHGMVPRVLGWTRYYAGWADKVEGLVTGYLPSNNFEYTLPEPYGVVAHIITWNAPLLSLAMKVPAALSAGNTVVIKPAEFTPYTAHVFAELALEAGMPPGVVNVLPGGPEAGEALVRHRDVDKISFTGGPNGARSIMRAAADSLKPLLFELGGKSANLVFPDVDVASTAAYCAMFGVSNSGQGCALPTRIIVHESIYDEFLAVVSTTLRNMPFGDPLDPSVMVGPMVNQAACQRVQKMIDAARHAGAGVVAVGGASVPERYAPGNFVMPTLFRDVDPDSEIAQREIFGPVLCLFKFSDEDQGVGLANSTEYGLAAYVQTNDLNVAQRMSRRLRAGSVFVNQATPSNLAATPFGGMGLSGFGREGGKAGLDEFIRTKGVAMSVRDASIGR